MGMIMALLGDCRLYGVLTVTVANSVSVRVWVC